LKYLADRPRLADCALLFGLEALSTIPYLFGIGFYSDDWGIRALLAPYSKQGVGKSFHALVNADPALLIRPVQAADFALSFTAFGPHAAAYQVVNLVLLGIMVVLFYLVLVELQTGRKLTFVLALVFGLLPHYSTDRFWVLSQQAALCMVFAFLGIYALLRATRFEQQHSRKWEVLAILALVLSVLSYEVAIGLIIASFAAAAWRIYMAVPASSQRAYTKWAGIAIATAVLLAVGILKNRIQTRISYHHHFFTHLGALTWHAIVQAVRFNFWTYCLHMPAVLVALHRRSALTSTAVCTAAVIACIVTAYLWRSMGSCKIPCRRTCLWLIILGFILFGLGFALFFPGIEVNFSTAGIANRVAIAAALGASCTLVAMVGLACSVLKSELARARAFSLAIGLICGMNSLVVSGIGFFWSEAASQQAAILKSVLINVRSLPRNSVLLLDGFCRYTGPGVVFETDWDTSGAIQLTLGDFSLSGDVVSPNMRFLDAAVESTIYGQPAGHYAYGDSLFVYNVRRQVLSSLTSKQAADAYLRAMNPTGDSGCPVAYEGDGESVF